MGRIVFAGAMSHAPHITGSREQADPAQCRRFYDGVAELATRLHKSRPDVLVVIASDHLTNFFSDCMPAFCIGLAAEYSGPVERWIRIPPFTVPGAHEFASEVLRQAFDQGLEPAFARSLPLEHGIAVPLSLLTPGFDVPIVPVIQNCMVPPLPSLRRCFDLGAMIRAAAERSSLRVAVLGTGGLSHWPGAPESGDIDVEFDRSFLSMLASGTPKDILGIPDARLDQAGFGAWEVRQWATALGASGGAGAEVLAYEPIAPWETGCAAAVFRLGTAPEQGT